MSKRESIKPFGIKDIVSIMYDRNGDKSLCDKIVKGINDAIAEADWYSSDAFDVTLPLSIRRNSSQHRYAVVAFAARGITVELIHSASNQHGSNSLLRVCIAG